MACNPAIASSSDLKAISPSPRGKFLVKPVSCTTTGRPDEVSTTSVAEPTAACRDIAMLGDTELTSRVANEFLILPRITCHDEWFRERPPTMLEPSLYGRRAIYRNLHTLSGALREIKEKGKLSVLLTIEPSLKVLIGHGRPTYDRCVRCIVAGDSSTRSPAQPADESATSDAQLSAYCCLSARRQ
jgi:hypothetical protein